MIGRSGMQALRALVVLGGLKPGEWRGASSIARSIGAPETYLGKILQQLAREGILESQRGMRGGFRLASDPGRIRLLEILEPIEKVSRWNQCFLGYAVCSDETSCSMHEHWGRIRDLYLQLLATTTLANLMEKPLSPIQRPKKARSSIQETKGRPKGARPAVRR